MVTTITKTSFITLTTADPTPLAVVAIVTLIILLVLEGLTGDLATPRAKLLARSLTAGIAPLVLVFLAMVAARLLGAMRVL